MAFTDQTPDSGHWCSRADCMDVVDGLDQMLRLEEHRLNRAIHSATGYAKSILRSRWPDNWPFTAPPEELREAVAAIAVYRAIRRRANSGGAVEIADRLKADAADAEKWLHLLADSEAHLSFASSGVVGRACIAKAPTGEFGFRE